MDMAMGVIVNCTSEILKKLSSIAASEIGLAWGVDEELKKLQNTLEIVESVIEDAEERQVNDKTVRHWLKRLKNIAYDAEDILDEVAYDTVQYKIEGDAKINGDLFENMKNNIFSPFNSLASSITVSHKIKNVNEMLDNIAKEKEALNLRGGRQEGTSSSIINHNHQIGLDRDTSPFVDDTEVFGREKDKSIIIEMLIQDSIVSDGNLLVIPIVGFGGLGKTTLAQLVFNDEKVIQSFDLREWVCVANDSSNRTLLKEVFKGVCDGSNSVSLNKNQMQKRLMEKLSGKKFLMVLDDVWNSEQWTDLKIILKHGAKGSRIIVTSRTSRVAEIMGTISGYHLNHLSEDTSWAIFEQRAFRNGGPKKTPTFEKIGREIVVKCGGVPLVVKALGGLMHSMKTVDEWLLINNNENIKTISENDIMRVLRLSYDHLASPLKRCFEYCAVFPKDTEIVKDDLIRQWMAHGFIQTLNDSLEMEDVGNDYFNNLCWNSFFQEVKNDTSSSNITFKMHDLMHDLALSIVGNECFVVEYHTEVAKSKDIKETRHLWMESLSILENLNYPEIKLRTCIGYLLSEACDVWLKFKWIRVLCLEYFMFDALPSSIGNLKLLRYLCIKIESIEVLPQSICQLYLLETLDVQSCHGLKELPGDLWKLTNLRHLLMPYDLEVLKKFGGLYNLRTISKIIYLGKEEDGRGIGEFEHLNHLRGRLNIYNMENVRSVAQAEKAKLNKKNKISTLSLNWDDILGYEDYIFEEAAEALDFPPNLQELYIHGFPGKKLPTKAWSLAYLADIVLKECERLKEISITSKTIQTLRIKDCPKLTLRLGSFTSLKELYVSNIHNVVVDECSLSAINQDQHQHYLPSLTSLTIKYVPAFRTLPRGFLQRCECLESVFVKSCKKFQGFHAIDQCGEGLPRVCPSNLKVIQLEKCPGVESLDMRGLTSLQILTINFCIVEIIDDHCHKNAVIVAASCPSQMLVQLLSIDSFASNTNSTFLTYLRIHEVEDFTTLPEWLLQSYCKFLQVLQITGCQKFRGFMLDELQALESLQQLEVEDCRGIKSSPFPKGGLESLPLLHTLTIGRFSEELDHLPFPAIEQDNDSPLCSSLKKLTIWGWSNLNSLPHQLQHLTALETLDINHFDALTALPEWFGNLSSLRKLVIYGCKGLMHLPPKRDMQRLSLLCSVRISECPLLSQRLMTDDQERLKMADYYMSHDKWKDTVTHSLKSAAIHAKHNEEAEEKDSVGTSGD